MEKKVLNFWKKSEYYSRAREGSLEKNHPGMKLLFDFAQKAESILDLGCGEGTRLGWVSGEGKINSVGIDISSLAVKTAQKQFPKIKFLVDDVENPKYKDKFDLVFSAFVLEHLNNPKCLVDSMVKSLNENGVGFFMAPNFGAPSRRSPNSKKGKIRKLIIGVIRDLLGHKENGLGWETVIPKKSKYTQVDDDALSEPYILTLVEYLKTKRMKILKASSLWELEPWSISPRKSLFKLLGILGMFPFKYWGPQLLVVFKK